MSLDLYTPDPITWIGLRSVDLPLARAVSDAKVSTGRQLPLSAVSLLFVELQTRQGHTGLGFSYTLRTGGPAQYAHARELAPLLLNEDGNDIARLWGRLSWASASIGRSGLAVQSIAAFDTALWDLKAKAAGQPLWALLGGAQPCGPHGPDLIPPNGSRRRGRRGRIIARDPCRVSERDFRHIPCGRGASVRSN